ncbi:MAG: GNAT family N-acetyltransferase [Alphaproteobacteria bacterium]
MSETTIRLARRGEADRIADIELGAMKKFDTLPSFTTRFAGYVARPEKFKPFIEERSAFVAVNEWDWPIGFSLVEEMDGEAYLAELDVDFDYQGQGLGRRLIAAACDWARRAGFTSMLLSTFRDVPWNAPYYARQGFVILNANELSKPGIKRQREHEAEFLDLETRVFMRKLL